MGRFQRSYRQAKRRPSCCLLSPHSQERINPTRIPSHSIAPSSLSREG